MIYRPKHFSRHLRQLRYLSKLCNKYQEQGSTPMVLLTRVRNKLRYLLRKLLYRVSPGQWIGAASFIVAFLQTAGVPLKAQHFLSPVVNPFQIAGLAPHQNHGVVDIDNDGDLDIVSADYTETYELELIYLENVSMVNTPEFSAPQSVPLDLSSLSPDYFFYDIGDIDDDGDLDILALVGYVEVAYKDYEPIVAFIENIGTPDSADFAFSQLDTLSTSVQIQGLGFPHLTDIDADGDLDLFFDILMYDYSIRLMYYENTGNPGHFEFAQGILEPFDYEFPPDAQYMIHAFGDLDDDGDLDILALSAVYDSGLENYLLNYVYYMNDGSPEIPHLDAPVFDPFNLPDESLFPVPCVPVLADWDLDGDLDLSCSYYEGPGGFIFYFENTGTSHVTEDEQKKDIHVNTYPNPVGNYFKIVLDNAEFSPTKIEISDINGRLMYSGMMESNNLSVHCENWIPGTYIIRAISDHLNASRILHVIK